MWPGSVVHEAADVAGGWFAFTIANAYGPTLLMGRMGQSYGPGIQSRRAWLAYGCPRWLFTPGHPASHDDSTAD